MWPTHINISLNSQEVSQPTSCPGKCQLLKQGIKTKHKWDMVDKTRVVLLCCEEVVLKVYATGVQTMEHCPKSFWHFLMQAFCGLIYDTEVCVTCFIIHMTLCMKKMGGILCHDLDQKMCLIWSMAISLLIVMWNWP